MLQPVDRLDAEVVLDHSRGNALLEPAHEHSASEFLALLFLVVGVALHLVAHGGETRAAERAGERAGWQGRLGGCVSGPLGEHGRHGPGWERGVQLFHLFFVVETNYNTSPLFARFINMNYHLEVYK